MVRGFVTAVCLACLSPLVFAQPPATIVPRPRPAAARTSEPTGVLRADSSLVVIPTWVTTSAGKSVTGLTQENFRLTEDNVEQRITYFAQDDAPLSIGLLFDASGSMRNKIDKASESLAEFFKTANQEDEFFLVEFNDRAKLTIPFTRDAGEIYNRAAHTKPAGRTSLLDGIGVALRQMKKARHLRKALVIMSDGGDNWSWHTVRQIREELLESDIQLYAMGIFDREFSKKSPSEERRGPALLDELAEKTGGRHYRVGDLNDLPVISAKIGSDLRNEYLLGFYSDDSRDGRYHHVKVNLAVPDNMPSLRANYRRGYYAAPE